MEQMRPHQLAAELANTGYEVVNGRVESARLASVIERAQSVWRELLHSEFESDEHGHASLSMTDSRGDYQTASDHIDSIRVTYHDQRGRVTPLGSIHRLPRDPSKATAYVTGQQEQEPLLPGDPRWNAVVGTIERAVDISWDRKRSVERARADR